LLTRCGNFAGRQLQFISRRASARISAANYRG
jgi:hypothetical protein